MKWFRNWKIDRLKQKEFLIEGQLMPYRICSGSNVTTPRLARIQNKIAYYEREIANEEAQEDYEKSRVSSDPSKLGKHFPSPEPIKTNMGEQKF